MRLPRLSDAALLPGLLESLSSQSGATLQSFQGWAPSLTPQKLISDGAASSRSIATEGRREEGRREERGGEERGGEERGGGGEVVISLGFHELCVTHPPRARPPRGERRNFFPAVTSSSTALPADL
ncbi:hypothetical protein EYF80_035115 [Liparis tanakae]|uniref:Uncharacterized protein n=1 Tax=Liparis tanakae TaxID=230148 RepID=A0A4Z2GPE2_9TELE|nr:hypothetical protein EYF80_035115 [Liparis tanakae]